MTVKDLIEFLQQSKPELPVILSKDSEGNDFRNLWLAQEAFYVPNKYGAIDVYNQEEAPKASKQCITLWPS